MLNDLRYAIRTLRQNRGFAFTAIVSIALGIGANATIFSLADGLVFRPLPVPKSSQVITLRSRTANGTFGELSYADYVDFRDANRSFDGLIAYQLAPCGFAVDSKEQPQLKYGLLVSGNFFRMLGVEPQLGRGFLLEEDRVPGRDPVVILSHDFWKNEFSAASGVIGRSVRLNGVDFTVIGVAPESFTGMDQLLRPAFFVPAMMGSKLLEASGDILTNRSARSFTVKGRLKPGIPISAADAEAAAIAMSLERSYPVTNGAIGAALRTERQTRIDTSKGDTIMVGFTFAIVSVALLIACANVANLMLSRGRARSREIAVRLAIGASRSRLVRQLMTESLVIALAGGALSLITAQLGIQILGTYQIPSEIPIQFTYQLDYRVLWFTLLVSLVSAIVFGLAPALQSTKTEVAPALKAGQSNQGRRHWFGQNALVTLQVAGSLILLVIAAQLYRGFASALSEDPVFRKDHLILMTFDPSLVSYTPVQTEQFFKTLLDGARVLPGVKSAALTSSIPMSSTHRQEQVIPEGYQFPRGKQSLDILAATADENYFETLGIPILAGRGFLPTDRADSPRVAVVNEAFARRYLGQNPIGKRFHLTRPDGPWVEVIGVAATSKYRSVFETPREYLYESFLQYPQARMTLVAQTYGDPVTLAAPLQEMVRSIDSNLPIFGVRTMGDFFEQRSVKLVRLIDEVFGSIGFLGLSLALVGLYAVVAYQVARMTREIGIRMAIGADRLHVMRMILKQAALLSGTGVGIGMMLSFAASRALTVGMGVPSFQPILFILLPVALLLTTLLAAAIPARRAARVDPMVALRED
jgi:putative ABC transport system permease protein